MGAPVDLLRRVPLLAAVDDAALVKLAARFVERSYDRGAPVVSRGSSGQGFFIIAEGEATVDLGDGKVAHLSKYDFFGEIGLIDGGKRSADITAETHLRCWGIGRNEFRTFVKQDPEVAWRLLEVLAARLRVADAAALKSGPPPRRHWRWARPARRLRSRVGV
jgi:CRP-like cAMP-binding protein